MADVELDARVTALKENGDSGTVNGKNKVFYIIYQFNSIKSN